MPSRKRSAPRRRDGQQTVDMDTMIGGRDVPAVYANTVRVLASLFDFTLVIGQAGFKADGTAEMREAARVNLSPQHAKALLGVLAKRVAEYEDQFGVLPGDDLSVAVHSERQPPS